MRCTEQSRAAILSDCLMKGNCQVPINHSHYDQMYQSAYTISVEVQVPGSDNICPYMQSIVAAGRVLL